MTEQVIQNNTLVVVKQTILKKSILATSALSNLTIHLYSHIQTHKLTVCPVLQGIGMRGINHSKNMPKKFVKEYLSIG